MGKHNDIVVFNVDGERWLICHKDAVMVEEVIAVGRKIGVIG